MKKLLLDIEYDYDFELFGVASSSKEYKIAWALNKFMRLRLVKQKDICYSNQGREKLLISNFEFCTGHSIIRMFRNKALGINTLKAPYLLPDIKEFDYVLQISGGAQHHIAQEFTHKLHHIPLIQFTKRIDPLKLKFKENLIF